MTYSDFTLEAVERAFGVTLQPAALFPSLAPLPVPLWLEELLAKGRQLTLISEKARSEFIVAPLLLASREISQVPWPFIRACDSTFCPSKAWRASATLC